MLEEETEKTKGKKITTEMVSFREGNALRTNIKHNSNGDDNSEIKMKGFGGETAESK